MLEELKARYSLEASKRQFERELATKKRTIEKQLENRKMRSSQVGVDDSGILDSTFTRSEVKW